MHAQLLLHAKLNSFAHLPELLYAGVNSFYFLQLRTDNNTLRWHGVF
jgi:hypothetical protein